MPLFYFTLMQNNVSTINPANAGCIGGFASAHETGRVSFSIVAARRTVKEVFNALRLAYMKVAHKVSLCSTAALSSICTFELDVPSSLMYALAAVVTVSATVSFYLIYNDVAKEEEV